MAHEVNWNKVVLEEFIKEACLTEREEMVLRTRVRGWSREKTAQNLFISIASVDKCIASLKKKYDMVSAYDPILPPRKREPGEVFQGFGK